MKKEQTKSESANLRQKAEEQLKKKHQKPGSQHSEADILKLIHELEVHQIELEMQNEELKLAKEKVELIEEKYAGLFDYAPFGYLSLTKEGEIIDLNFSAARLLGKERSVLVKSRFAFFVSSDTKPIFNSFLQKIFQTKLKETCEVELSSEDSPEKYVLLEGIVSETGETCLLTAIDITENKRKEEGLFRLSFRQVALLSAIPDIVMEVNNNKVYTWVNQAGIEFFGEDVLGKEAAYYFEGEQETYNTVQPLFNGSEEVFYVESWQRRKDGEKRLLGWWCRVLKDEKGNVTGALSSAQDITERKLLEIKLDKSRNLLSEVEKTARIGGWEFDVKTLTQTWTEETFRILEIDITKGEPKVPEGIDFINSVSRPMAKEAIQRAIEFGEPFDQEWKVITAKGNTRWVHSVGKPYIEKQKTVSLSGSFQDITERKQAEEALQESELKYRTIFKSMDQGFYLAQILYDENGNPCDYRYIDVNSAFEQIIGLSQKQIIGKTFNELVPPDPESGWLDCFIRVAMTAIPENYIFYSEIYNSYFEVYAFLPEKGKFCAFVKDVTESIKAKEALRESEERYRSVVDVSPDAIIIHSEGKIVFANQTTLELIGAKNEGELLGKPAIEFVHPDCREAALSRIQEMFKSGKPAPVFEERMLKLDGSVIFVEVAAAVIPYKGKQASLVVIRDSTERKQHEDKLREKEVQYRTLADTGTALIWTSGTDKLCNYFNEPWFKFTGRTIEQELGNGWAEGIHPDDFDYCLNIYTTAFDKYEPFDMEYRLRHVSGEYRWLRDLGTPNYNSKGEFIGYIGHCFDITEQKKVEQALQETKELFSLFMQYSPVYTYIKDVTSTESRVLQASKNFLEMVGIPGSEIVGKTMEELYPSEFAKKMTADDWVVVSEGKVLQLDEDFNGRNYTTIKFPIIQGEKRLLAGYTFDITQRKQMEEALKKNEAQLTAFMNFVPDLILIKDSEFRPVFANEKYRSLFPIQDWIGKTPGETFPPEVAESIIKKDTEAMEKGYTSYEEAWTDQLGKQHIFFTQKFKIAIPGAQPLLGAIISDITDRKQTEEALLESEQLFRGLFNASPMAINLIDPHHPTISWPLVDCNEKTCQMNGYKREELIGHSIDVLNSTEGTPEERIAYFKNLKKEGILHEEVIHRHKDGHLFPVEVATTIITIGGHELLLGIDRDITERKQAEEALLYEQFLLHSLMDNSLDVIYFKDSNSRFIRINKAFAQRCSLNNPNEALGKTDFDLFTDAHSFEAFNDEQEIIKTGIPVINKEEYETWLDGRKTWALTTKLPLHDKEGKIVGTFGISKDITEHKLAEEALQESEKKFRTVVEEAVEVIFTIDDKGYFTYTNPIGEKSSGYSLEELKKIKYVDLIEPGFRNVVKRNYFRQYLERIPVTNTEYPFKTKSGEIRWFNQNARIIIENNEVTGFFVISRDVTERRLIQNALQESEERYRSFISQVSDGVYRFESNQPMDLDLAIEEQVDFIYDHMFIAECNDAFLKMYGVNDPKDMIGRGFLNFHGVRDNEKNRDSLRNFIKNGYHVENAITEELNVLGQPVFFSNNFLGIIENNCLVRIWGTQTDITEKTKANLIQQVIYAISNAALSSIDLNELIELIRVQLGKLLDTTNFYIAFYNEETGMLSAGLIKDEKDNIKTWPAEKSSTGYLIRQKQSLLITDSDVKKLQETGEIAMVGTPSKVWLGVPLWVDQKVIGAIVVQDYENREAYNEKDKQMLEFISNQISISIERKIAEQELKNALVKAQESERLKSAFLANMSHEIRTPMNGILGFSELLKNPELTGVQQNEYIEIIEKSGIRMLNIINDLIDISKVEAGLMDVNITETDINEQMEYLYTFFKPEVEKKGMRLSTRTALFGNKAIIKTDREKFYSILTNLVKNAIKYSNEGSIEFGYVLKDQNLKFHVKDTGIGIAKEWHEAIFNRFYQVDITKKSAYQGAGLGLSITKAYVEMLGGEIWVESEQGKGSTFYFTMPYQPKPEEKKTVGKPGVENSGEGPIRELKILIAEDDLSSEMLLKIALKKYGKEFITTKTGVETVEAFRNNPDIDLILMDIQLPDMDGLEATQKIREFDKKVIIIAQTAYGFSSDRENALAAGCNDYISKPIKQEILVEMIEKYFLSL